MVFLTHLMTVGGDGKPLGSCREAVSPVARRRVARTPNTSRGHRLASILPESLNQGISDTFHDHGRRWS